jgi:hypothetical protein
MARTALQLVKAFSAKRVALDLGKGVEVACVVEDVTLNYGRELLLLASRRRFRQQVDRRAKVPGRSCRLG